MDEPVSFKLSEFSNMSEEEQKEAVARLVRKMHAPPTPLSVIAVKLIEFAHKDRQALIDEYHARPDPFEWAGKILEQLAQLEEQK